MLKRNIITELCQLLKNENVLRVRKEYKILRNRLGKEKTSLKVAELITKFENSYCLNLYAKFSIYFSISSESLKVA